MPKVTVTNEKGLVQAAGSGLTVESTTKLAGAVTISAVGTNAQAWTATTSLIDTSAADIEMTLTQPANTVLVDVGFVLTTAIAGTSGTSNFKVGTSDDGAELVAATALMSSNTAAAIGSGVSLSGLKSQGAAALAVVADAAMYTSASRTIYLRLEDDAAITAGAGRAWITYMYLPA